MLQADACSLVTAAFACVLPVCAQIVMRSDASLSIYGFQLKSDMVNFSFNVSGNFHLRGSLCTGMPMPKMLDRVSMSRILDPTKYPRLCWYPKHVNRILSGTQNKCFNTFRLVLTVFYQPKMKTEDTREEQNGHRGRAECRSKG